MEHHTMRRLQGQDGVTAVEYAMMVSLIAGVIVASVTALGLNIIEMFDGVQAALPW